MKNEVNRTLVVKKKITLFFIILLSFLTLGAWNNDVWGATPSYHDGIWYSLYDVTEHNHVSANAFGDEETFATYTNIFAPANGSIIFKYKRLAKLSTKKDINIYVGGTKKASQSINSTSYSGDTEKTGIGTNISKVEFKTASTGAYIKDVKIPLAKHIRLDDGSTYGTDAQTDVTLNATAYGNTSDAYHINLRSFYVDNTTIKYESNNSEFHFGNDATTKSVSVKANSCAANDGTKNSANTATELGNPDNQEVDLYFTPSSNKNGSSSATITIYDGTTKRATISVSAKVKPTYYFKATAVATAGGAEVKASFTEDSYSAASATANVTATAADVASLTKTAYFYAPLNNGDYYFQGWYAEADCSGTRLSTDQTLTRTLTANSLNSASPTETKYYAQYKQVIRAEFSGEGQSMMVDGTYNGISYIRTSSEIASASSSDNFWYEIRNNTPSGVTTGSDHASQIISYDPSTKVVTARNAGTATLVLHQKNVGFYEAKDKEYTFTVYKYNSVFANVEDLNVKVDGNVSSTYTLTYNKPNADYLGEANHVAGAPALNTGSWYYTLTQNVTTGITTGSDEPTKAIVYNAESKTATGKNAGTGTIHLYQAETYKYNAADEDFIVNVTKYEPVFTWNRGNKPYYFKTKTYDIFSTTSPNNYSFESSNEFSAKAVKGVKDTLVIYNVEEDATIKVSQEENYLWSGKEVKYLITPIDQVNHVTRTITNSNHTAFETGISSNTSWNSNGYKMGDGGWDKTQCDVVVRFSGIPEYLSFDKHMDNDLGQLPVGSQSTVYQSSDGNDWSLVWTNSERKADVEGRNIELFPTTRYLKFSYKGSIYCYYNNIKITELNKFDADRETIDFGLQGAKYGIQVENINFTHANAGRTANVTIEGEDAEFFNVTPNVVPGTGRDLSGTTTYRVSFDNKNDRRGENAYNAELVFSDNLGNEERVTLTGKRDGKSLPVYTFNPNNLPYYFNSTIAHIAASTNTDYANCRLTYSTTDSQIAYVDADGYLHIGEKAGSVTITVKQTAENADFRPGSATFTFTPRERPSLSTPFVLTKDVYDNAVGHGSKCYWESNEGGRIRTGNTNILTEDWVWVETTKLYSVEFNGAPDKITFEYKCGNGLCTPPALSAENHMWEIRESADGANWSCAWYSDTKVTSWTNSPVIQLKPETRFILFVFYGNYEGYWRNIKVTSFDGYKYLRADDGQYLSRGSSWGTRAVIDAFGIAGRVTRSTSDNTNYFTQFQFVDNGQYLFEADNHDLYTDNGVRTPINWTVKNEGGLLKVQSANDVATSQRGYYVTVREANKTLTLTNDESQATLWHMEDYTQHADYITRMLDAQATAAAQYDFENITTLAGVRAELRDNEYDFIEVDLPSIDEAHQQADRTEEGTASMYGNEISGLTPGFYTLSFQAFSRLAPASQAWNIYEKGLESVVAYVYANDVKYPIKSLFDASGERLVTTLAGTDKLYPNGYYYSDDLAAAKYSFDNNAYINDVYVYVPADEGKSTGTLRYGIVNPSYVDGAWTVYGDISLKRLTRAEFIFGGEEGNTEVWGEAGNWNRPDGRTPTDQSIVIVKQDAEISGNAAVYSLTIEENVTVTVKNGATLTIGEKNSYSRAKYGNLHVENGGKVVLTTGELVVNDFILDAALGNTSKSAASGQLLDANNMLRLINDAYFQISFDPNGAITYGWYDFTVPFEVDLMTGVFDKNGNKLTYNTDYAVMEYSEAKRAAKAARPWTWFSGTMQPGKLYTITLDDEKNWNTFLFKKKANTAISINDSFNALCTETADTKDKGWNGLGNGMLQHCQLNNLPAQTKIQICDHENERYVERDAADYTYAVGTAFFVQVKEPKTIDLTTLSETRGFLAPMRENKVTDEFRLALIEEGQTAVADHLWVSANEEANGDYVIGRDLLKMGTPTNAKVAQMWATRNEMILCDAEMPLIGNEANVNISLYAPKEAVYTIGVEKAPEDANLYLTYNDQVIWDLTLGAYTLELAKGTTTGYGLRIEVRTPQVATGIESTATDTNSARKVLINNTLYIVTPEGKMYDAVGKNVQ